MLSCLRHRSKELLTPPHLNSTAGGRVFRESETRIAVLSLRTNTAKFAATLIDIQKRVGTKQRLAEIREGAACCGGGSRLRLVGLGCRGLLLFVQEAQCRCDVAIT